MSWIPGIARFPGRRAAAAVPLEVIADVPEDQRTTLGSAPVTAPGASGAGGRENVQQPIGGERTAGGGESAPTGGDRAPGGEAPPEPSHGD